MRKRSLCCLFFLILFYLTVDADETLREQFFDFFNSVKWVDGEPVKTQVLSMPYRLNENNDLVFGYSEFDSSNSNFPFLEGVGVLDYSGVEPGVIWFFSRVGQGIEKNNLGSDIFSKHRSFLPFLVSFVLNDKPAVKNVFFSRPEFSGSFVKAKFRVNTMVGDTECKYFLLSVTGKLEDGEWVIWEFEGIKDDAVERIVE